VPRWKFSTQPGEAGYDANANIELWVDGDPGFDAGNPFRNSQAQYFLPSVHEWYKAAHYDPNADGGAGGYWSYPTGSDSPPTPIASGTAAGTAVYDQPMSQGPADIALAGGLSPYGVMGMGGNVWEWQETEADLLNDGGSALRDLRGGLWSTISIDLSASLRNNGYPVNYSVSIGFRVARIPEPSSIWMAALGMIGLMMRRGRLRDSR
jgi:formylglycine-generating enzyme required for sulfatase activity